LANIQASSQGYAQQLSGGNVTPANVVGMAQDQISYAASVKALQIQEDTQKEALDLLNPGRGGTVDTTA
jgi:hypothetical protein